MRSYWKGTSFNSTPQSTPTNISLTAQTQSEKPYETAIKYLFRYLDYKPSGEKAFRKNGTKHIANPVATVFSGENYDLSGYHVNKKIMSDRIDGMTDVTKESALIDKSN